MPGEFETDESRNGEGAANGDTAEPRGGEPSHVGETETSGSADAANPIAAAQSEATKMRDAWLRTAADFDNFRKRSRRELEDARRSGREDLLKGVLPVFDNLERAVQSALRSPDVRAVADGLSMVLRQFVDTLAREGITRVPTVGHPFDPGIHEAIQQVETSDHAPGTVVAEVQPGYTQGDRLVRAAMVVVAKPKSEDGAAGGSNQAAS